MSKAKKLPAKKIQRFGSGERDAWDLLVTSSAKIKALAALFYAADNCGSSDFGTDVFGVAHILEGIAHDLDDGANMVDGARHQVETTNG